MISTVMKGFASVPGNSPLVHIPYLSYFLCLFSVQDGSVKLLEFGHGNLNPVNQSPAPRQRSSDGREIPRYRWTVPIL